MDIPDLILVQVYTILGVFEYRHLRQINKRWLQILSEVCFRYVALPIPSGFTFSWLNHNIFRNKVKRFSLGLIDLKPTRKYINSLTICQNLTSTISIDDQSCMILAQYGLGILETFKNVYRVEVKNLTLSEYNYDEFLKLFKYFTVKQLEVKDKIDLIPLIPFLKELNTLDLHNLSYNFEEIKPLLVTIPSNQLVRLAYYSDVISQAKLGDDLKFIFNFFFNLKEFSFTHITDINQLKHVFIKSYPQLRKLILKLTVTEATYPFLFSKHQFPNLNHLELIICESVVDLPNVFAPDQIWINLKHLCTTLPTNFEPKLFPNLKTFGLDEFSTVDKDILVKIFQLPNLTKFYCHENCKIDDDAFKNVCGTKLKLQSLNIRLSGHFTTNYFFKFLTTCLPNLIYLMLVYEEDESWVDFEFDKSNVSLSNLLECEVTEGLTTLNNFIDKVAPGCRYVTQIYFFWAKSDLTTRVVYTVLDGLCLMYRSIEWVKDRIML